MYRSFHLRQATRRRLAWLAMLMLLWQQVAVAAYACTLVPAAPAAAVATAPAMAMAMDAPASDADHCNPAREAPATPLCQKHCLPDHFTQVDAPAASVPFLAMAAAFPPLMDAAVVATCGDGRFDPLDRRRAAPSPLRLYCALLI